MAIKTFLLRSLVATPNSTASSSWTDVNKITDGDLTTYGLLTMKSKSVRAYSDFYLKSPVGISTIPPNSTINSLKLITYAEVHPNAHVVLGAVRKYTEDTYKDNGTTDFTSIWITKGTLKVSEISDEARFGSWTRDELVGTDGTNNEKYSGICFFIRVVNESTSEIQAFAPRYFQLEVDYTPPSYTLLDTSINGKLYDINNPTYDLKAGHSYEYGTVIEIQNEADEGYEFIKYNGILENQNKPQITITSDLTISADFQKIKQHVSTPYVDGKKVIAFYAGNKKILKIYQGTTSGTGTGYVYKQLY